MDKEQKKKRILVAPLDWGLGHASRCIPIIRELRKQGAQVIIGADKRPMRLLKDEFPECETVRIPGMGISYPKHISMSTFMAIKAPRFFQTISEENKLLKLLVENYQIDGIVSDNRYGLYHKDIPSVLITHQLFIQAPFFKRLLKRLTAKYIEKYDCCWIPDLKDNCNLSGALSHQTTKLKNLRFIGPISRFMDKTEEPPSPDKEYERQLMVILSGPEPNRSKFERLVLNQLKKLNIKTLVVRGLVGDKEHIEENKIGNIQMKAHLNAAEMRKEICKSEVILCRAGYSSVMDLAILCKKAILVPTEGQTEQEYLAKHLSAKNWLYATTEKKLDISVDIQKAKKYSGLSVEVDQMHLQDAVNDLLKSC